MASESKKEGVAGGSSAVDTDQHNELTPPPPAALWIDLRPFEDFQQGPRERTSHPFPAQTLQNRANELPPKDAVVLNVVVSAPASAIKSDATDDKSTHSMRRQKELEETALAYLRKGKWLVGKIISFCPRGKTLNHQSSSSCSYSHPQEGEEEEEDQDKEGVESPSSVDYGPWGGLSVFPPLRCWNPSPLLETHIGAIEAALVKNRPMTSLNNDDTLSHQQRPGLGLVALDVGCGSGRDMAFLAARGWTVLGIDNRASLLRQAVTFSTHYTAGGSYAHGGVNNMAIAPFEGGRGPTGIVSDPAVLLASTPDSTTDSTQTPTHIIIPSSSSNSTLVHANPIIPLCTTLKESLPITTGSIDLVLVVRFLHRPMLHDIHRVIRTKRSNSSFDANSSSGSSKFSRAEGASGGGRTHDGGFVLYSHFVDGVQYSPIGHPKSPDAYLNHNELERHFPQVVLGVNQNAQQQQQQHLGGANTTTTASCSSASRSSSPTTTTTGFAYHLNEETVISDGRPVVNFIAQAA